MSWRGLKFLYTSKLSQFNMRPVKYKFCLNNNKTPKELYFRSTVHPTSGQFCVQNACAYNKK